VGRSIRELLVIRFLKATSDSKLFVLGKEFVMKKLLIVTIIFISLGLIIGGCSDTGKRVGGGAAIGTAAGAMVGAAAGNTPMGMAIGAGAGAAGGYLYDRHEKSKEKAYEEGYKEGQKKKSK
jgi:hypothetical protein